MKDDAASRLTDKLHAFFDGLADDEQRLFARAFVSEPEVAGFSAFTSAEGRSLSFELLRADIGNRFDRQLELENTIVSSIEPASGQAKGFTYQRITWDK